jgi:hypothetical protein
VQANFSAKDYMTSVISALQNPSNLPPSVILNDFEFLRALYNGQNFSTSVSPTGDQLAGPEAFNFAYMTDAQKATIKAEATTLFQSFKVMEEDPTNGDADDLPLYRLNSDGSYADVDSDGNPVGVTLDEFLNNPNSQYTIGTIHCSGDVSDPKWAPDLDQHYHDNGGFRAWGCGFVGAFGGGGLDNYSFDEKIGNGQIHVDADPQNCYHGGGTNFTPTGSGSSWESVSSIQSSDPAASKAAEDVLGASLNQYM